MMPPLATLYLGDKQYMLRPSFSSLCNIERRLDISLVALASKLANGQLTLKKLVIILEQCMLPTPEGAIGDLLLRTGISRALQSVSEMLILVLEGANAQEQHSQVLREDLLTMIQRFPDFIARDNC